MATVPSPSTAAVLAKVTAAAWNTDVRDEATFWTTNRPICYLNPSGTQSIANNAWSLVNFDTEIVDRDQQHDTVTSTSRIVIGKTLGLYFVFGLVAFAAAAGGTRRGARIDLNGTAVNGAEALSEHSVNVTAGVVTFGIAVASSVTDYVELRAFQDSGGSLSTTATAEQRCSFGAIWIGS